MTRRLVVFVEREDVTKLPKVRAKDGKVGAVFNVMGPYCSVQHHPGGLYKLWHSRDLTEIDEAEFRKSWR